KAYTISTEMVGKYQPSIDTVRVPDIKNNVPTDETYRIVDGDSTLIETESYNPYSSLTANNGNDVIAENYNFMTTFNGVSNEFAASIQDGNFFITRASGDVKSTMNNGTLSADNEGKYTFDKVMTYKNGNDEFIFNGGVLFTISTEDITFAGEKTVEEITYNAYDYKTTFNMVYYVDSVKVADNLAPVSRNILVAKEVEDLVPGTIASMAITAVPAHWTGSSFADGSGLSLYNYVSADILVAFLRYAYHNKDIYLELYDALPIAGVDGTLKDRMKNTPAMDNVHAKTGTLSGVSSLAGYCKTRDGRTLAFAIINQGVMKGSYAKALQDKLCNAMCE
ncbi:MAG: D-alanyl-D-alanine carboxypeptidase, partial [Prevotella sp.]|nr:D-alanyl-D-alanine carboxypeptidase [Prevotella sp.]